MGLFIQTDLGMQASEQQERKNVFALQYSLCNLQVPKILLDSVAGHLSILRIQFAASVPYMLFVIQVMHKNTCLWVSPWCFQNKCPCLTVHYTRALLQKLFFSVLSLTDMRLSLESFPFLTDRSRNLLFSFMMQDYVKLHESYWITYPYESYLAPAQKWYFL